MDRRDFLRRAALVAAGAVAADQLEIVERLTHRRRFFPGWSADSGSIYFPNVRISGVTYRLAEDQPLTITFRYPTEPIIGAKFTPDVWSPPTIEYSA